MMKVFTTDHQYLATWTVTPEIDKFALKLTEVADVFDNGIDRVKTKTEFPAKTVVIVLLNVMLQQKKPVMQILNVKFYVI